MGKLPSQLFNVDPFKEFDRVFVGFDEQLKRMHQVHDELAQNIPNYPPYNIKKVDENKYVIEMAVAGFGKSDIEIEMVDDKLVVRGNVRNDDRDYPYLWQGIANRAFTRMFALGDHIEVKDAALVNGMLKVALEKIIPENKKPKKIDISDEPSTVSEFAQHNSPQPQFLVEGEEK
jgi:molecular chaperone IbpA